MDVKDIALQKSKIKTGWITWTELEPYKEQMIDMELELMIKYHFPDWKIPRSYPEERVNKLKDYLADGLTFVWAATFEDRLLGYYWAVISQYIDKKRWNMRSLMFIDQAKSMGLGTEALLAAFEKAKEMGCDQAASEYVPWNDSMASLLKNNGYKITRIEVVKELSNQEEDSKKK